MAAWFAPFVLWGVGILSLLVGFNTGPDGLSSTAVRIAAIIAGLVLLVFGAVIADTHDARD